MAPPEFESEKKCPWVVYLHTVPALAGSRFEQEHQLWILNDEMAWFEVAVGFRKTFDVERFLVVGKKCEVTWVKRERFKAREKDALRRSKGKGV